MEDEKQHNEAAGDTAETSGEESSSNSSEMQLEGFDIDDKLEEKLKKHGLNRRHAKTILHAFLNDDNVRDLFMANFNKDTLKTFPEEKSLRSKQSKSTSDKKVKFTELPLLDEDEEDDAEYHPDVVDMETTFDGDTSRDTQATITDAPLSIPEESSNDSFMTKLKRCDNEIQEIRTNTEEEIIALRTRSKHSLLDIAIAQIELDFKPPDVTEDMYQPSFDDDLNQFLAECMLDDILSTPKNQDADDDEEDPDYDFMLSDAEDAADGDDYRDYTKSHIPREEVKVLLKERHAPITYQGEIQPQRGVKSKFFKPKTPGDILPPLIDCGISAKDQLKARRKKLIGEAPSTSGSSPFISFSDSEFPLINEKPLVDFDERLEFTVGQLQMMQSQLRQHLQLLTQINLLCRNTSAYSTIVHESHALLKELQQLSEHDNVSFNISSSYFNVPHLSEALDIAQLNIRKSPKITRLSKSTRPRGVLALQRNIGVTMATSPVFAFPDLLPIVAPPKTQVDHSRLTFSPAEDSLLVLGVAQMQDLAMPWQTLVHHYMMPCKLPEQLGNRYSNSFIRQETNNPITMYRRTKQLPAPPKPFLSAVGHLAEVQSLRYLIDASLPDWLIALQNELEALSLPREPTTPKAISPKTSSPKAVKRQSCSSTKQSQTPQSPPSTQATVSSEQFQAVTTSKSTATVALASPEKTITDLLPTATNVQSPNSTQKTSHTPEQNTSSETSVPAKKAKYSKSQTKSKRKRSESQSSKHKAKNIKEKTQTTSPKDPNLSESGVLEEEQVQCVVKKVNDVAERNSNVLENTGVDRNLPVPKQVVQSRDPVLIDDIVQSDMTSSRNIAIVETDENVVSKNLVSINQEDSNPGADEEEEMDEEAVTTEYDYDEETDFHLNEGADEMSEEEEATSSKKRVEKKAKKELKVKWKKQRRVNPKQPGGRLHRHHPSLIGKRKSKGSEDDLGKSLRESAERVKLLEEETIVQLDPLRGEKEKLFAQCYMKRIEETLSDRPDVFIKVLETLVEFKSNLSQPPVALFNKLKKILESWPELLEGFVPFLMPEQAYKCGLLQEQQVYARARKFLRQLEIRFQENQPQLTRILNTFKTIAETGIYREKEVKNTILSFLKCDPYLQEEFLTLFDDERPPESRLHADYEEITWSDDLLKNTMNDGFEHIHIPTMGHHHEYIANHCEGERFSARNISTKSPKQISNPSSDTKKQEVTKEQEASQPTPASWDDIQATDPEEDTEDSSSQKHPSSSSILPDLALISEDALSCSPFKRHNASTTSKVM